MRRSRFVLKALVAGVALVACSTQAALVNAPLPTNAYISFGGYDWAWAFPVAPDGRFGQGSSNPQYFIDLSYQAQFDWRLPTATELLLAPDAIEFVFPEANVPFAQSDPVSGAFFLPSASGARPSGNAACATPYFATFYRECDWINGQGIGSSKWWNPETPYGQFGQLASVDVLVIRSATTGSAPEPGSLALAGLGLSALWAARRRRR